MAKAEVRIQTVVLCWCLSVEGGRRENRAKALEEGSEKVQVQDEERLYQGNR